MRRKIIVIGLGIYGLKLLQTLLKEKDIDILGIDIDINKINKLKDELSKVVVCDATSKDALREAGVEDADVVIIGIRDKPDVSLIIALHLKEMGVKEIWARAADKNFAKILKLIRVDEVFIPAEEIAIRHAKCLAHPNLRGHDEFIKSYTVSQFKAWEALEGKSLSEINLTRRFGVRIIGVKKILTKDDEKEDEIKEEIEKISEKEIVGSYVIEKGDIIVVGGTKEQIDKMEDRFLKDSKS